MEDQYTQESWISHRSFQPGPHTSAKRSWKESAYQRVRKSRGLAAGYGMVLPVGPGMVYYGNRNGKIETHFFSLPELLLSTRRSVAGSALKMPEFWSSE